MVAVLVGSMARGSLAQERPLRVHISEFPPCVTKTPDGYSGFDIEIWEAVANTLDREFVYEPVIEFQDILQDVRDGEADAALSCISINSDREKVMDFSHQYMESGLQILVLDKEEFSPVQAVRSFFSPVFLKMLFYLALFIIVCGHIVWWTERGSDAIGDMYYPGIFEAFWYTLITMTTVGYGDIVPRKWTSRVIAILIMITGIAFFSWIIGGISSAITLTELRSRIESPQDLRGRTVATEAGSTSVEALRRLGAVVIPVEQTELVFEKLLQEEVEAVVLDKPVVVHYARYEGLGKVKVVGPVFEHQYYGIALQEGSPLREPINRALLDLKESFRYQEIYQKWFGTS